MSDHIFVKPFLSGQSWLCYKGLWSRYNSSVWKYYRLFRRKLSLNRFFILSQKMNSRKSSSCGCWRSRKTLACTINYQRTTSTTSPEKRSSAVSATWHCHRPRPPCRPLPCPLPSFPSLWSLPVQQEPLLCPWPHSRLQRLCRRLRRSRAPRNLGLTLQTPLWPPTTRSWSQPNLHAHSPSPKQTALNCSSSHNSRWCSTTQVRSSRPPTCRRCFPWQTLCSSRLPCWTVPSAGAVLLTTAAT